MTHMLKSWRLLVLAAALNVTADVGLVLAQTIMVRNAPPGSTVEVALNATAIGTATVGAGGDATLTTDVASRGGKTETDANFYVDVCGGVRRVVIVERGASVPPKAATCERSEIPGLFLLRAITTILVDVGGSTPTLWLRQGAVPDQWLRQGPIGEEETARTWRPSPTGFVVSGGAFSKFRDAVFRACGNVEGCSGDDSDFGYAAGVAFWFAPFVAAEATYLRPGKMSAGGTVDVFRFDSSLDAHVISIVGKAGVPIGPVRIYGQAGLSYHEATFETVQGLQGAAAGSVTDAQTFTLKTKGWGRVYGGGVEAWVTSKFAIYGDAGWATLKGDAVDDGEGLLDERLNFVVAGVRVRLGR
jgi:hypothetical protein